MTIAYVQLYVVCDIKENEIAVMGECIESVMYVTL